MRNLTPVVKYLLITNVVIFIIQKFLILTQGINLNGLFGLYYFGSPYFKPFQLFTNFFMHDGLAHIAFNMISLYSIGVLLEQYWGSKRLFNFYLICGIGAGLIHLAVQGLMVYKHYGYFYLTEAEYVLIRGIIGHGAVGASGAIFGLFTAVALLFPNSEFYVFFIPFPIKAKYLLIAAVIISVYLGMMNYSGDHIGHFAHLGGIVTGFILVKLYNKDKRKFY